jgi:hydroxymethylbilane synthase
VDGQELLKAEISGAAADGEALGRQLAEQLLLQGADRLLAALH